MKFDQRVALAMGGDKLRLSIEDRNRRSPKLMYGARPLRENLLNSSAEGWATLVRRIPNGQAIAGSIGVLGVTRITSALTHSVDSQELSNVSCWAHGSDSMCDCQRCRPGT